MPLFDDALKIASRINDPVAVAAFVSVIALLAFWLTPQAKRPKFAKILLVGIIFLGSLPLAARAILESRGIYHIRAIILGQDGSPVEDAEVTCSIGGEPKRVRGGWEFDIPSQTRPAGGEVVLFASKKSAFLTRLGEAKLKVRKSWRFTFTATTVLALLQIFSRSWLSHASV